MEVVERYEIYNRVATDKNKGIVCSNLGREECNGVSLYSDDRSGYNGDGNGYMQGRVIDRNLVINKRGK